MAHICIVFRGRTEGSLCEPHFASFGPILVIQTSRNGKKSSTMSTLELLLVGRAGSNVRDKFAGYFVTGRGCVVARLKSYFFHARLSAFNPQTIRFSFTFQVTKKQRHFCTVFITRFRGAVYCSCSVDTYLLCKTSFWKVY